MKKEKPEELQTDDEFSNPDELMPTPDRYGKGPKVESIEATVRPSIRSPAGAERASIAKDVPIVVEPDSAIGSRERAHAQKIAEIQGGK